MAIVMNIEPRKIPLTEFMKALGQEPVAADGNLRIYNAPYSADNKPTMVVNVETNLWRDTESGTYGGIYDLAYELTGSCSRSDLDMYIATEMSALRKITLRHEPEPPKEPVKPKRGRRL